MRTTDRRHVSRCRKQRGGNCRRHASVVGLSHAVREYSSDQFVNRHVQVRRVRLPTTSKTTATFDFSFTFDSVQTQTDLVWRYERYSLIREYFDRPPLFPPLILITHLITLIRFVVRNFCTDGERRKRYKGTKSFSKQQQRLIGLARSLRVENFRNDFT
jgi:hypothetical protein